MKFKPSNKERRFLAGLFTNLAAGWIGVILISPGLGNISRSWDYFILTINFLAAIICSVLAIKFESEK